MRNRTNKIILHIATPEKFIPGFIDLIRENFPIEEHIFIIWGDKNTYRYTSDKYIFHYERLLHAIPRIMIDSNRADKIIIHGLFSWKLAQILTWQPWTHKKINWIIFGGDLYFHKQCCHLPYFKKAEKYRRQLISRVGGLITYVEGDYKLAVKWYGAKGKHLNCIAYTSNIFTSNITSCTSTKTTILAGNSADPSNNHLEIFRKIQQSNIVDTVDRIYCPLSYGDMEYALEVNRLGKEIFGGIFYPLNTFTPLTEYLQILESVDVAIFAHERQQAMGNTINLLGMGKKVIMKHDTTSWKTLSSLGLKIYPFDEFDLSKIDLSISIQNNRKISDFFNKKNLINQLLEIFN